MSMCVCVFVWFDGIWFVLQDVHIAFVCLIIDIKVNIYGFMN